MKASLEPRRTLWDSKVQKPFYRINTPSKGKMSAFFIPQRSQFADQRDSSRDHVMPV